MRGGGRQKLLFGHLLIELLVIHAWLSDARGKGESEKEQDLQKFMECLCDTKSHVGAQRSCRLWGSSLCGWSKLQA